MTSQPQSAQPTRVGDYAVLTKLGEGGMGIVHLARGADGRRVALKVLRPHVVGDNEARARLAREVASLERVRSPWIAEILDADPWADVPYVVTRYVPGLSLHDHVAEEGPIADRDLHWLAGCLAEGIAAVHSAGVLHRDVKPSNVLMEGRTPILIDFGLARVADDPRLTQTGWLLGTPGYLAPEILYGDDATPASDVHAWAATVAYAGNGRAPYGRGPSMAIMDRARRGEHDLGGLTGSLREVVDAALSPDPLERPSLHEILAWIRPLSTRPELPVADPPVADDFTLPLAVAAQGGAPAPVLPPPPPARPTRVLETEVGPVPPAAPFPAAAPTLGPAQPGPPAPPAHAMERLGQEWDEQWGAPYPPVAPRPPLAERLRRGVAVGCGAILLGAATAAAPYVTAAGVLVAVWLLRAGSLAASSLAHKRVARGAKWHDGIGFVVSSPWHLVRAITGTVVLVLWSAGIAAAAGLICYALATGVATMLFTGGTALGVALWTGIASSRFRGPLSRVVHPLSRGWVPWSALCGGLLVAAVVLGAVVASRGIEWLPAASGPFGL
ncbi:putative Ser/Thr protein kinase [Nocardioides thalensis]|uniref:Putative Ser/Thr protein kinase n=1 Tax=Nocardioides thalensis TaxID=1914755 RepID=A0A853C0L9_9ACTN|nr:putative Ser/Thr protein kinase [Nocardioides thalensis]